MLGACLCCRKKVPKNELLGMEGMVTLTNPENVACTLDSTVSTNQCKYNEVETKRASGAPNRSLPDIPVVNQIVDQTSEFYTDVADVLNEEIQQESECVQLPQTQNCLSKQSSISQGDDLGIRYARVQTPPHMYDKEHPYAQLNNVRLSSNVRSNTAVVPCLSSTVGEINQNSSISYEPEPEIPAASAIAGMVSASHELPYMTPPIPNTNAHFSGDSQDSTKGYTSISVREPLAIMLANRVKVSTQPAKRTLCDSHYTTVSDDSDETYAAIEDPNYIESGTYAHIQTSNLESFSSDNGLNVLHTCEQIDVDYDSDRSFVRKEIPITVQIHSREASFSSNTSSGCPSGSPKPEKRQANSPLPPTPSTKHVTNLPTSNCIFFERNFVSSTMNTTFDNFLQDDSWIKGSAFHQNPCSSKDIEEMYAKVVKKNKFSASLHNSYVTAIPNTIPSHTQATQSNQIDGNRLSDVDNERKDHGYETIPGESANVEISDGYSQIIHPDMFGHKYEQLTLSQVEQNDKPSLEHEDREPKYETLEPVHSRNIKKMNNFNKESNDISKTFDVNAQEHFSSSDFEYPVDMANELYETINYQSLHDSFDSSSNNVLQQLP